MKKYLALSLVVLATSGCSSLGIIDPNSGPADWPELKVVTHRVPTKQMRDVCAKVAGVFGANGCAAPVFSSGICHIFESIEVPFTPIEERHERRDHCELGKDHFGETTLRDSWAAYKAEQTRAALQ